MRRAGFPSLALLIAAFVSWQAQCVALCDLGICPQPADAAPHSQCPHHSRGKLPGGAGHACQAQQPFFAKSGGNWIPAPAMQPGFAAAETSPAQPFSWNGEVRASTSPPAALPLTLATVLRV